MKIQNKGSIILVEDGDSISDILYHTMCKCGHALYLHGNYFSHGIRTFYNSQCTVCGFTGDKNDKFVCGRFEVDDAKE